VAPDRIVNPPANISAWRAPLVSGEKKRCLLRTTPVSIIHRRCAAVHDAKFKKRVE
jgi:hypothetical protein